MPDIVWDAPGRGFGDLLVAVNFCAHQSLMTKEPARISEWGGFTRHQSQRDRIQGIIDIFDFPKDCSVVVTDELATVRMYGDPWKFNYFPTRKSWIGGGDYIAYQFDGRSSAAEKNPPKEDIDLFNTWAKDNNLPVRYVGLPCSIDECVEIIRHAKLFVGACSGMSHLSLSVGCPTFVVEYKVKINWWYGANRVRKCEGMNRFIESAKKFLEKSYIVSVESVTSELQDLTVAVVSNSDILLGSRLGPEIDACDRVVRFNKFSTKNYERDVGRKTDIYCCHFEQSKPKDSLKEYGIKCCFVCCNCDQEPPRDVVAVAGINKSLMIYRNYLAKGIKATTGMTMIQWLVSNVRMKELRLYGFSGIKESHYFATNDKMTNHHNVKMEAQMISALASEHKNIVLL